MIDKFVPVVSYRTNLLLLFYSSKSTKKKNFSSSFDISSLYIKIHSIFRSIICIIIRSFSKRPISLSFKKKSQFSINSIKAKKPDTSTQQRTYWIKVTRASSSTIDPSKATRERLITTLFILRMPSLCLGAALRPPSSAMDGILRLIDESVCPSIRGSVRVERWKLIKRPSGRPATTRPGYSSLFVIKTVLTSIEKSDFCLAENRYGV